MVLSGLALGRPETEDTSIKCDSVGHQRHLLSRGKSKAGWLFGSGSGSGTTKKHSKARDLQPYQSPAERAETLKQDRAIDLAALLELKQLVQHQSVEFFKTWVEDGNPCDFAKVTCNQATGRVSELDLIFKEDLVSLYPELNHIVTANASSNPGQASIATARRQSLATSAAAPATWQNNDLPGSATKWPKGQYPYTSNIIASLPTGPAFMKLNQTLKAFHLSNAIVTNNTLPSCWGSFTGMQELSLHGLDLEGTLPAEWAGMINMTHLLLGDNPRLSGSLPSDWSAMQQLKLLDLSLNYDNGMRGSISGSLPPAWSNMTKLEMVDLWRQSVAGILPPSWASLKRLQVVSLSDTGISGTLPSAWSSLLKLNSVHLANTLIGGALPSSWGVLPSLSMLDLRGTQVIEPVPRSWHAFCRRNGTKVWDHSSAEYKWPKPLQIGKVAIVLFPWQGPNSSLWQINHKDGSMANICHKLAMANKVWNLGVAVMLTAVGALVAFRYRFKLLRGLCLHSRFD